MAKQTFTTGQVLTAAQMTSLQQTAMGGGAATAKTASYVLVAADAGTTVAMNAAGATTITVNTGLFAAGDTVFIQNLGAGACTVTAGTATVATAGSLILPQNDAGILYFTSASAAIFYDYIQAGAVSPLTTKGDLYTFSTSDARLGVGANGTTLVADSAEATGLKWATPAAGGMTLLSTTTLSGASTTISSISQSYTELRIVARGIVMSTENDNIKLLLNGDTANYVYAGVFNNNGVASTTSGTSSIIFAQGSASGTSGNGSELVMDLLNYTSTGTKQYIFTGHSKDASGRNRAYIAGGVYVGTSAITSLTFESASPYTFSTGTVLIYGVK